MRKDQESRAKPLAAPWLAAALGVVALLGACTDTSQTLSPSALAPPPALDKKSGKTAELDKLAAASKAGHAVVVKELAENLARYERNEPCRTPLRTDDPVEVFELRP